MFGRIRSIFTLIKSVEVTTSSLFYTIFSIIILRTFLENILEQTHLINLNLPFYLLIIDFFHISLSWITLYILITFILYMFSKDTLLDSFKISLFGFIIIMIVPILDYFIFSSGVISYKHNFIDFNYSYMHLFNIYADIDFVTSGVRVEVFLVIIMTFLYLLQFSFIKATFAAISIYSLVFIYGYLPAFYNLYLNSYTTILNHAVLLPRNEILLNMYIYIPITLIIIGIFSFIYKKLFISIVRVERLSIYIGLYLFGVLVASIHGLCFDTIDNFFDIFKIMSGALAIFFAFLSAIVLNDIYDFKIDEISNKNRALTSHLISIENYKGLLPVFIFLSIAFAISVNQYFIFLILPMLTLSYIYSANPIRARNHFVSANIILSLIAIIVFLSGYTVIEHNMSFLQVDKNILLSIFLIFFVVASFKDIKDEEADNMNGVTTLANIFKERTLVILKTISFFVFTYILFLLNIEKVYLILIITILLIGNFLIKNSEKYILFIQFIVLITYISYIIKIFDV